MTRGVCWYLVGSVVLVSLAGCGHGFFQAEREPWRAEAEIACLKSGAVKESAEIVRIDPISGPGMCGADYPLKVAALGEASGSYGFADEDVRPPGDVGNQPRWPVSQPPPPAYPQLELSARLRHYPQAGYPQAQTYPQSSAYPRGQTYPETAVRQPGYAAAPQGPISLAPPGVRRTRMRSSCRRKARRENDQAAHGPYPRGTAYPPRDRVCAPYSPFLPSLHPDAAPSQPDACRRSDPRRAIPSPRSDRSR